MRAIRRTRYAAGSAVAVDPDVCPDGLPVRNPRTGARDTLAAGRHLRVEAAAADWADLPVYDLRDGDRVWPGVPGWALTAVGSADGVLATEHHYPAGRLC